MGACQITRGTNNASGKRNNINKIGYQMLTPSEEKRNLQFPLLGGHELLCYQFKPISRDFTYTLHMGFIGDTRSWTFVRYDMDSCLLLSDIFFYVEEK